jgi:hypothetical protein
MYSVDRCPSRLHDSFTMKERAHTMSIKVDGDEMARLHALADAGDESIGAMVRRWMRERYTARFGDAVPPVPKLKPGPRRA